MADVDKSSLLPSKIVYKGEKIVGEWLDKVKLAKITIGYVESLKFPEKSKNDILKMIEDSSEKTGYSITYSGDKKIVPPEFYEVLTALKLMNLLVRKDKKVFDILGIPRDENVSTVHIRFPKSSIYSLTDYEVSINKSYTDSPRSDERPTYKISIKSKVSSSKTNTVKFADIFDNEQDAKKWMDKRGQKTQGQIAVSALSASTGKAVYYPIHALSKIDSGLVIEKRALQKIARRIDRMRPGDDEKIIDESYFNLLKEENIALQKFVKKYVVKKTGSSIDYNIMNLTVACEKFLVRKSLQSNNDKNFNFYKMFHEKILKERKIAYSVAKISGNTIVFNYYSMINWKQEYKTWIALRSKNYAGSLTETLGLDV